jgi:hypothetical protein
MGTSESEHTSRLRRVSRRGFILGGAGVAAVATASGLVNWIREDTWEPPLFADPQPPAIGHRGAPRQPIAVLVDPTDSDSFALYLGEVLRTEGIAAFQFESLADIDEGYLASFPLVLLPPARLTARQAAALSAYVARGGALIAMRPDAAIAGALGLAAAGGTTSGGYLLVRGSSGPPLQVHDHAAHFTVAGATVIADLLGDRTSATGFAAVTSYQAGSGRAMAFAFDLARNIALIRQGDPAAADQERDGVPGIRATDMFAGWLDPANIDVPQADLQARLLVALIEEALSDRVLLPRLWYFPGGARSLVVLTGDAHGCRPELIEELLRTAEAWGGRASVYYSPDLPRSAAETMRSSLGRLPLLGWAAPDRGRHPTPAKVASWRARGHEFGVHPRVEAGPDEGYVRYLRAFHNLGYDPVPPTVRTHAAAWHGWVETAAVQARRGFRMNLDYYHYGPVLRHSDGSLAAGHLIGSGLPMRLADQRGRILNVFQQPTQLVDEHWLTTMSAGQPGGDADTAAAAARGFLDLCVAGSFAAVAVQCHADSLTPDQLGQSARRWLTSILGFARERGLPVWPASRWLAFVEARRAASIADLAWDSASHTATFSLDLPRSTADPISVLLPAVFGHAGRLTHVLVDGKSVDVRFESVGGRENTWVTAMGPHSFRAQYGGPM